jgi:hypothetical protein
LLQGERVKGIYWKSVYGGASHLKKEKITVKVKNRKKRRKMYLFFIDYSFEQFSV